VRVELAGTVIASTTAALRVLETSHPPTYYVPRDDFRWAYFTAADGGSFCEWKGTASYWNVTVGDAVVEARAWSYADPSPSFADIADAVAFYPADFDCFVDDQRVEPQPGSFYGGWITPDIVGPFKGIPGSALW